MVWRVVDTIPRRRFSNNRFCHSVAGISKIVAWWDRFFRKLANKSVKICISGAAEHRMTDVDQSNDSDNTETLKPDFGMKLADLPKSILVRNIEFCTIFCKKENK